MAGVSPVQGNYGTDQTSAGPGAQEAAAAAAQQQAEQEQANAAQAAAQAAATTVFTATVPQGVNASA